MENLLALWWVLPIPPGFLPERLAYRDSITWLPCPLDFLLSWANAEPQWEDRGREKREVELSIPQASPCGVLVGWLCPWQNISASPSLGSSDSLTSSCHQAIKMSNPMILPLLPQCIQCSPQENSPPTKQSLAQCQRMVQKRFCTFFMRLSPYRDSTRWAARALFALICSSLSFSSPLPYFQDPLHPVSALWGQVHGESCASTVQGSQLQDLSILPFNWLRSFKVFRVKEPQNTQMHFKNKTFFLKILLPSHSATWGHYFAKRPSSHAMWEGERIKGTEVKCWEGRKRGKKGVVAGYESHIHQGEEKETEHFRKWKQHYWRPKSGKIEHL